MRVSRIYVEDTLHENKVLSLNESTSHYLARVLRVQTGQPVTLFNGDGFDYPAHIVRASKNAVDVEIQDKLPGIGASPVKTHIGQVMSKGDRMDYMVQKATELGVDIITPLTSDHCEVKLKYDREEKKINHWQQIAISASEQCGRATLPQIRPVQTLDQWLAERDERLKLTLHPRAANELQSFDKPDNVAILIGPEGGLSDKEVDAAQAHGFHSTLLGPRTLRTETAPVVALTAIQWLWGDIGNH